MSIWRAEIPEICGYGIYGTGLSEKQAILNCRKAYKEMKGEWKLTNPHFDSFNKAWDYFGGRVDEIKEDSFGTII